LGGWGIALPPLPGRGPAPPPPPPPRQGLTRVDQLGVKSSVSACGAKGVGEGYGVLRGPWCCGVFGAAAQSCELKDVLVWRGEAGAPSGG
jgi:hypothetical protein